MLIYRSICFIARIVGNWLLRSLLYNYLVAAGATKFLRRINRLLTIATQEITHTHSPFLKLAYSRLGDWRLSKVRISVFTQKIAGIELSNTSELLFGCYNVLSKVHYCALNKLTHKMLIQDDSD